MRRNAITTAVKEEESEINLTPMHKMILNNLDLLLKNMF